MKKLLLVFEILMVSVILVVFSMGLWKCLGCF